MERLLKLGPDELQSGIYPGVNKSVVQFWANSENMSFKELGVRRINGAKLLVNAATFVRALAQATVSSERRIYAGTDTQVVLYELGIGGGWETIPLTTWITAGQYADLESWGNWLIATNGLDPVLIWKNVGVMTDLAGTTFTSAKILKRKLVYLFAINTSNGETMIEWSDESDPETWTPADDNMAGNYTERDIDSEFVAATDLGPALAIYSRNSLVLGTYVGAPNVWGFRKTITGVGAVSRRSIVPVAPLNYGLNTNGVFVTDGNSFTYLDDPFVQKWLERTVDWGQEHLIWGFHDSKLSCVTWYFLDSDNEWHYVSYHYIQKRFTIGRLALTAGIQQEVFNYPIVARDIGGLGGWFQSDKHFGSGIEFFIQSKPLDFGTTGLYKSMQLVRVDGTWSGDVKLRVRAHNHAEDLGQVVLDRTLGRENYFDFEAPQFSFEFYGSGDLVLNGLEFFGVPGGVAL